MLSFKGFLSEQLILEAKIDDYKAQEKNIPFDHDNHAAYKKPHEIIDHFHNFNPTGDVNHTRWVVNRYKAGELKQEDAPAMRDTLHQFNKYRDKLPKKQIHQYKSIEELRDTLRPHVGTAKSDVKDKAVQEGADLVHNSDKVKLYHVHTTEASQELGKGMPWCTSHRDSSLNMFSHYNKASDGRFYIAHLKGEKAPYRKLGIGIGTGEFQDENNTRISHEDLEELVKRNPEMKKIPALQGARVATTQDHNQHFDSLVKNDPDSASHLKNINDETIANTLKNADNDIKEVGMKLIKGKHLDDYLSNKASHSDKTFIYRENKNIEPHHIDAALDSPNHTVVHAAITNKSTSPNQLSKAYMRAKEIGRDSDNYYKAVYLKKEIAEHPNTPHEILDKLVKDDDHDGSLPIAAYAAANPNSTSKHVIDYFNNNPSDEEGALHILKTKNHDPEVLNAALDHESGDVAVAATRSRHATKDVLMKALEHPFYRVAVNAAGHANADAEVLEKAHRSIEPEVRAAAAENPNLHPDEIHRIASNKEEFPSIRRRAISNPSASAKTIDVGLDDDDPYLRNAAISHPNATSQHITKALKDNKDLGTTRIAARHPNIDREGLRLATNLGWADHEKIDNDFVTGHLSSTNPEDHLGARALAKQITKPEHFNIALNHPNANVRHSLAFNKNLPPDIRARLKKDPDTRVREAAELTDI